MFVKDRLKYLREAQRISQEELSNLSGISVRTIQRIEKGEVDPRPYTIREIIKVFNISIDDFNNLQISDDDNVLRMSRFRALNLLVFVFPFIYLLFLYRYWKSKKWSRNDDITCRKVLSFQLLWVIFNMLFLLFSPLFIDYFGIDLVIGHSIPTNILGYLLLSILGSLFAFLMMSKNNSLGKRFKSIVPNLF